METLKNSYHPNITSWLSHRLSSRFGNAKIWLISFAVVVSACSSDSDQDPKTTPTPPPPPQMSVSGKVQKGEFTNLQVVVYPVNENGQTGTPFSAQTNGSEYNFLTTPGQIVNVRAHGTFVDELNGLERIITQDQALQSVFAASAEPQNVNILTTITTELWLSQTNDALTPLENYAQQQSEVAQALGFDEQQNFAELDITDIQSEQDPAFTLLMLSAALLQQDNNGTGLPPAFSDLLDVITEEAPLASALDIFNGIDIGATYAALQSSGVITTLPDLSINEGSIFLCEPNCLVLRDVPPSITLSNAFIYEGQGEKYIRLSRTGNTLPETTVSVSVTDGSAVMNQDYVSIQSNVTFAAGERFTSISIEPIIDQINEINESFTIAYTLPQNSIFSLRRETTAVTIKDGKPASAVLPDQPAISTFACLINVGIPSELLENLQGTSNNGFLCEQDTIEGLTFSPNTDNQGNTLYLATSVQADCNTGNCGQGFWPFSLTLESYDTSTENVIASEAIGTLLYRVNKVLSAFDANSEYQQAHFTQFSAELVESFVANAASNNNDLRLRLMPLPSSNANVIADAFTLPSFAPSGPIQFGDLTLQLAQGASLSQDNTCPNASDLSVQGDFTQEIEISGTQIDTAYSGEVCATYQQDENGGKWVVSQSNIDITGEGSGLAEGYYYFAEVSASGQAPQRTSSALPFAILGGAELAPGVFFDSFIGADTLPFAFNIVSAALTENGILINYDRTILLDQAFFANDDPRAQSTSSNTNMYGSISAGQVIMTDYGFSGNISVSGGTSETLWPKGRLEWQGFTVELLDNELLSHDVEVRFAMSQSTDCSSIKCSQGNTLQHAISGVLNVDRQGSGISSSTVSSPSQLTWGALASAQAWELVNALQENASATLVLPGYIQRYLPAQAENAADGLVAHRRANSFVHSVYGPSSQEFTLGNFFAPGITIGPELYVNDSGQPEVLNGSSLANLAFTLNNEGLPAQNIVAHEASKFVIQNAGVTGVINGDPASMPSVFNASGFDINLNRFALRTQNNTNDDFNWIDGSLRLDGDAKVGLAFTNLRMGCDGSLGDANMLAQACSQQCRLDSWRADIDIFKFSFTGPNQAPLACSGEPANLSLEHDISFKALDKNIAMNTTWTPQGTLVSSSSNPQSQYRFDSRDNKQGYPTLVESASLNSPLDLSQPETLRYGTLGIEAQIGLPFWLPLNAEARLANTLSFGNVVSEASVVVPRSTFSSSAYQAIENALNINVQADILEDAQFDFDARYEWGSTGFGFQLPVFYDVALANQDVSFLGRRQEIDMFVLDAGAGIDFIQPDRTKLSFGASADFAALKKVRFQVDLTDTAGLAKVDELLIQAKIIQEPVITPTFENIASAVSFVNDIAGRGLDPLMEKLLLESVTSVGQAAIPAMPNQKDPFDTLADTMAEIKNLPNHLVVQADDIVFTPINTALEEQKLFLRGELLPLVTQVEALAPGQAIQSQLKTQIEQVRNTLSRAEQSIKEVFNPVENSLNQVSAQITQVEESVAQAQAARVEIAAVFDEVTSVVASQCAIDGSVIGSESAGYLQAAFVQLNEVKGLVQLLSSSDVLVTLADLIVEDPAIKESINDTQETLKEGATALLTKVSEAEVAVRERLCQSDVTTLLTQVQLILQEVDGHIVQMQQVITMIDTELILVKAIIENSKTTVLEPLGVINASIGDIERIASERASDASGEAVIVRINSSLSAYSQGNITVLVSRNAGDVDIFDYAFGLLTDTINTARESFVNALQSETEGLFPYGDMSADQLRRQLVTVVMASQPVSALREELNKNVVEIIRQANSQVLVITDQANTVVQEALAKVESEANKVLEQATAPVRDIPLDSGKLDGFGVIASNELERAHIGAQWTMSSSDESEPGNTFGAALDAVSWSANGKAEGCAAPGAESNLDVTISALGIPAKIGESEITIKKVYLGFTLGQGSGGARFKPIGVNGGISTTGNIGFTEFVIYDPAFAAGIGLQEVYLGAAAGAVFSDIQAEVAFLVGKTCNQDILLELDPKVAQYIPLPATGFTGAYVRGAASVPVYSNGCPLTIGVAADMGAWILKGPPVTLGGLVGGGAYGKVGCVGALRGQIRALGQVNTDGDIIFIGEGFGVAGLGLCEPAGWTSVERSRQDTLCGTADAIFTAGYQNGWSVLNLSVSAIH